MLRFIGGPARCGKSTLVHQAQKQYHGQLLSLDNLHRSFLVLASEEKYVQLKPSAKIEDHSIDEWLHLLRARDRVTWSAVTAYLEAAIESGDDVMLEGCLWPDYISELQNVDYRAVFLIDTSSQHVDRLLAAAHSNTTHNNWMSHRTDEWIRKWGSYNIERSKLYIELAKEYHQPFFDVGENGFEHAQAKALAYLFLDT